MTDKIPGFTVATCPFKTFNNKVFSGSQLVQYSKKTGTTVIIPDTVTSARATDNYASVYCVYGGGLSKIDLKAVDAPARISDSCASFAVSTNGKSVWYKDLGNVLHYVKNNKDAVIAIGVDDYAAVASGKACAFTVGGSLYINKSGSASKSLPVETGDFTGTFAADASNLYYLSNAGNWQKIDKTGKAVDLSK